MWEALRYQYSMLIVDGGTLRDLHIKMTTTTITGLGSLNKTHPPVGSIIDRLRNKGKFLEVNQMRWSRKPIEGQEIGRDNMADIQAMRSAIWDTPCRNTTGVIVTIAKTRSSSRTCSQIGST